MAAPIQGSARKGMFFHTPADRQGPAWVAQGNFLPCRRKFAKNHVKLTADFVLPGYMDKGYPGAQKMYEDVEVLEPIRRKPGKKLPYVEKVFNRLHSKIRVYVEHAIRRVKAWRIMGDRYRNPLKKYDRINDIVCGLVNQRVLWLAERAA